MFQVHISIYAMANCGLRFYFIFICVVPINVNVSRQKKHIFLLVFPDNNGII